MEVLSPKDALNMLTDWVGEKSAEELPVEAAEVAKEYGYLPLALAMIGAMIRLRPRRGRTPSAASTTQTLERSSVPFRVTHIFCGRSR